MSINSFEIEQYMSANKNYFEKTEVSRFERIIAESNVTLNELNTFKYKSPSVGVILSVVLGMIGIDRFYSGNYIMGCIKLCTMGLGGLWWVIDWFLIAKAVKVKNQTDFYAFLTGQGSVSSFDSSAIKDVVQSKEVQSAFKDVLKSSKKVADSFDLDSNR